MQSMLFVVAYPDEVAKGFGGIPWLLVAHRSDDALETQAAPTPA
jgi:hypothetical protein